MLSLKKKKIVCNKGISFLSPICLCMISLIVLKRKKKKEKRKKQKNQNAFTWLQACFLGNVRDIFCNFLDDSHFQTNVIDDVENLFDYYLHITFFVLCTLTSCTHYTQINAKFCTYDCMMTNLVIFDYSWSDVWYIFFGWVDFEEKCFRSF